MLNKVVIGVVLTLVLALGVETTIVKSLVHKKATIEQVNKDLNEKLSQAAKSIAEQASIAKNTDLVVTEATERINKNDYARVEIKAKVETVAKRVANEKLPDDYADGAYVDSMWDAYCTAPSGNQGCASRHPTSRL